MFGGNQYYGLVASLREQSSGGDGGSGYAEKGFDPDAVYGEIRRELSAGDRRTAGLLWSMMDIYGLERGRVEQLYGLCAASSCGFLRDWCRFDRNLRNVIAANTARAKGMVVADVLLDTNGDEIALSLAKSSAADFSLRGELDYIDRLLSALGDTAGFVEKERAIDMIRWDKSDSLSEYDTFGMPTVLAYLVKVAITGRWVKLDPATGREMYDRLVASFDHTKRAPSGE